MEKPVIKKIILNLIVTGILLLITALLLSSFFNKGTGVDTTMLIRLEPDNLSMVSLGEQVYRNNCSSCHGSNLEGQDNWKERDTDGYMPAPPHDETGHTWHHNDQYLYSITKYGIENFLQLDYPNNMPIYEKVLSDKEILASLSYIKSTWPAEIQKMHDEI